MVFNEKEKEVLKHLVTQELKAMENEEEKVDRLRAVPINAQFRAAEEKYEYILEQILKKLK